MKRAAAALIALMVFLSPAALAEGRSFALNREGRSDLYSWDGKLLTPPDTYLGIYSLTAGRVAPRDELFAAVSAHQALPKGESAQVPFAILDAKGRQRTDFLYTSLWYDPFADVVGYVGEDWNRGVMTRSLKKLLPCEYAAVLSDGKGGLLLNRNYDSSLLRLKKGRRTPGMTGVYAWVDGYDFPDAEFYSIGMNGYFNYLNVEGEYWRNYPELPYCAEDKSGLYGFVNGDGKWAIEPRFDYAWSFSDGYASAREGELDGIIDRTGAWVIEPGSYKVLAVLPGGEAAVAQAGRRVDLIALPSGELLYSTMLTEDIFQGVGSVRPLVEISKGGRATLLNSSGRELMSLDDEFSFDLDRALPEDRVLAWSWTDCRLMDLSGTLIFQAPGLAAIDPVDGRALLLAADFEVVVEERDSGPSEHRLTETARFGLIDSDGNVLLPLVYRQLYPLIPGRYYAEDARRWGVIDEAGNWIVSGSLYDQLLD